jgi:hypothetical protein
MDLKERLAAYRTKHNLTWEQLFTLLEKETGYPCPQGTWVGWVYGKGFPRQAQGVFGKWFDKKAIRRKGS